MKKTDPVAQEFTFNPVSGKLMSERSATHCSGIMHRDGLGPEQEGGKEVRACQDLNCPLPHNKSVHSPL